MALNIVSHPYQYFGDPDAGRPIAGGEVYVGVVDLDPTIPANQKSVTLKQEDGTEVSVSQPIDLSAGGYPTYLGSPVAILVDGDYSLAVLDSLGVQKFYSPSSLIAETILRSDKRTGVKINDTATLISSTPTDPAGNSIDLQTGLIVETIGDITPGDGDGAKYLVVGPTTPGPNDLTLDNGNIAVRQDKPAEQISYDNATSGRPGDEVQAVLDDLSSESYNSTAKQEVRFNNYLNTTAGQNAIYLVGDSITEGSNATDYTRDSWAAIVRAAVQTKFGNNNWGFVNARDLSGFGITQFHTVSKTGFGADQFDGTYFGGIYINSTTPGGFVEFAYQGKDSKLVYEIQAGGGIVDVVLDGSTVGAIDTSAGTPSKAAISTDIGVSNYGSHTVRFVKRADTNPVNIMGVMYFDDGSDNTPVVHNVGRSSISAVDIADDILDIYAQTGTVVLALGVNDYLGTTNETTFRAKLNRILSSVDSSDGACIVCDFIFSEPSSNAYKTIIREEAEKFSKFPLLDFAELWFQDLSLNKFGGLLASDNVHPTEHGHQAIAELVLNAMGMGALKESLFPVADVGWNAPTLINSWVNFGGAYNPAGYRIDNEGFVHIRGLVKDGAVTVPTTIFTLPAGYRPENTELFDGISSGPSQAYIEVDSSGNVKFLAGNNTFLSFDGITFKAV